MATLEDLSPEELSRGLTYAGLVLVAFELVKKMVVRPIKVFYSDITFAPASPFKSYDQDVRFRHSNEFEACLLYLRDFMEAIDSADMATIQELRTHRNELAHDLVARLPALRIGDYSSLWERVDHTLFKMSNYRTYIEIGADPEFRWIEDWESVKGTEYLLFEAVKERVAVIDLKKNGA